MLIALKAKRAFFAFEIAWLVWVCHFNYVSKKTPRTFMDFFDMISTIWSLIWIGAWSFAWKRQTSVLLSFTTRPESFNNLVIISNLISRLVMSSNRTLLLSTQKLSSAKLTISVRSNKGHSNSAYPQKKKTPKNNEINYWY